MQTTDERCSELANLAMDAATVSRLQWWRESPHIAQDDYCASMANAIIAERQREALALAKIERARELLAADAAQGGAK